jgi:hypothetical protein
MKIDYNQAKECLTQNANLIRVTYKGNEPVIRQRINDITNLILLDLSHPSNGMDDKTFIEIESNLIKYSITL